MPYRKTQEARQLKGLSERTQESYLRSVRQLFDFAQCEPEALTEAQLRSYYLHRRNVSRWAPNTLRISYFAIQFFFTHVLIRPWPTLKLLNAKQPHSLPVVLSRAEVRAILACVNKDCYRAFLTVVSCFSQKNKVGDGRVDCVCKKRSIYRFLTLTHSVA